MTVARQSGKTVLVVAADKIYARDMVQSLEETGFAVIYSDHPPHHADSVPSILQEVKGHNGTVDAVIIHNSNIELEENRETAVQIIEGLKGVCPVLVCDSCSSKAVCLPLLEAGGKYINFMVAHDDQIANVVADMIAQQEKSGRLPG